MELVFYDEAVKILGVTADTLVHAVSRGELTRAGIRGNRRMLIKEQVMLFTGNNPRTGRKKRISYEGLSQEEKGLWQRYANELNAPTVPTIPDLDKLVSAKIRAELERQEAERTAKDIRSWEERYRKEFPFQVLREMAIA